MTDGRAAQAPGAGSDGGPEAWAGIECAHVRVGDRVVDELALTGHADRDDDIDRLAGLGVTAVRYPVLWGWHASGAPGDETDWAWAVRRLEGLRRAGVRPIVGLLHHGQGPLPGGLLDPGFVDAFAAYARAAAERTPWVLDWLPINEPLTTARFAGLYGLWAPHERRWETGMRMLVAQCLALRAAIRAIREVVPGARFHVNEDVGRTRGTRPCLGAIRHGNERRWLTFDLMTGRVQRRHRLWRALAVDPGAVRALEDLAGDPEPPDVLGVDHYVTSDRWLDHRLAGFPASSHGGDGRRRYADVEIVRVGGRAYHPFRHAIAETWARYGRPIALAEVQLAAPPDDQVAWWDAAWRAVVEARASGVDVRGVTAWSAFGAWEWNSLLCRHDGCYEAGPFDARDGVPVRTPLGDRIAAIAAGAVPGTRGGGWWARPDRVLFPVHRRLRPAAPAVSGQARSRPRPAPRRRPGSPAPRTGGARSTR